MVGADVVKILGYSEKLGDMGGIDRVQHMHMPLYKNSIVVRGTFMAPNGS